MQVKKLKNLSEVVRMILYYCKHGFASRYITKKRNTSETILKFCLYIWLIPSTSGRFFIILRYEAYKNLPHKRFWMLVKFSDIPQNSDKETMTYLLRFLCESSILFGNSHIPWKKPTLRRIEANINKSLL